MFNFNKSKIALAISLLATAGLAGCGSNQAQSPDADEGGLVSMKEDKDQQNRGADQSAVYNVSGDSASQQEQNSGGNATASNQSMGGDMQNDSMAANSSMAGNRSSSANNNMQNAQSESSDTDNVSPISQTITFEHNSAELTEEAKRTLRNALQDTGRAPMEAEVVGYTDDTGAEDYNQTLSERRAQSVRDFIAGLDANINEWEVEGRGEQSPSSSNDSEWGRAQNRRVSVTLRPMEQQAQQSNF